MQTYRAALIMTLYLLVVDTRRRLQVETALHWEAKHPHHIQILASCTATSILEYALSMLERRRIHEGAFPLSKQSFQKTEDLAGCLDAAGDLLT